MLDSTLIVSPIVSIAALSLLSYINGRQTRAAKKEDWERQDKRETEQRERAERQAQLLLDAQAESIARTDQAAATLAKSTADAAEKAALAARVLAERTDEAAKRSEQQAKLLLDSQAASIARTDEAAKVLAERTDEAAKQAAIAAQLLLQAQQDTIARTNEVARLAKISAASTDTQLKQIHTLVNSDMTAARRAELEQTQITLVMMRKVVDLVHAAGREATAEDEEAIASTVKRIAELKDILADRLAQQQVVEQEQRSAKTSSDEVQREHLAATQPEKVPNPKAETSVKDTEK